MTDKEKQIQLVKYRRKCSSNFVGEYLQMKNVN